MMTTEATSTAMPSRDSLAPSSRTSARTDWKITAVASSRNVVPISLIARSSARSPASSSAYVNRQITAAEARTSRWRSAPKDTSTRLPACSPAPIARTPSTALYASDEKQSECEATKVRGEHLLKSS